MTRSSFVLLVGTVLAGSLVAMRPAGTGPLVSLIVGGSPGVVEAAEAVARAGGTVDVRLPFIDAVGARVPAHRVHALARSRGVTGIAPNQPVRFAASDGTINTATINSVFVREIKADTLWSQGITGENVRVALVDTGVAELDDLTGRVIPVPDPAGSGAEVPCINLSGEPGCQDSYGHGTFMAGLIAGTGTSSGGRYKGVAPGAEIISIKLAGRDGSADVTKVLAAIQWVVSFAEQLSIRVLNLSLGTNSTISYRYDPLNFAVERAWDEGIAVIVSASNRGPDPETISKPGDDPLVITVGAVDDRETPAIDDDRLPFFSGRGPTAADGIAKPDLVAPGARVISLRSPDSFVEQHAPGGGIDQTYRRGSGTSMATAITSGAAALALQANPSWSPDRLKFALMNTTRKVAERDAFGIGTGLIDVHAAARSAPPGLANRSVTDRSLGSGSLDGSRGDAFVTRPCTMVERALEAACPRRLDGQNTAQGRSFDAQEFTEEDWSGSSWYMSQWNFVLDGSSWHGSSWYGDVWQGSSWYGSSWYGSTDDTYYGASMAGSSWYGAWS